VTLLGNKKPGHPAYFSTGARTEQASYFAAGLSAGRSGFGRGTKVERSPLMICSLAELGSRRMSMFLMRSRVFLRMTIRPCSASSQGTTDPPSQSVIARMASAYA